MQYDTFKVHAVLNEIDGFDHSRTHHVGVPAIFGMNFQMVSTAQKLPKSDGLTGGKGEIAEHGGADRQDRNVPILVVAPGLRHGRVVGAPVETTQIAPTTLTLLGLDPSDLQAVQVEHTRVLPSLRGSAGH